LNASFDLAREAARNAAGLQHYPAGALYVVATPIGNLADISLRALHVLGLVDAIACEDTRHTQTLLKHYGISRPLLAAHEHNESAAAVQVLERLQAGQRLAYVSDAGTPAVSDPGARLVAAARSAGVPVIPVPGASSLTAVLSVAGIDGAAALFAGFLPAKAGEREQALQELSRDPRAVVLLEAPHRIESLARDLARLGERAVTIGRELTKQFEDIATVSAQDLGAWLAHDPKRVRGEFALVLHPAKSASADPLREGQRVLELLLAELPLKTAVRLAAEITGAPRNALYEVALALKRS
jgi:16S rRNA (cytidine1402-2'-O)-methyltransferase